MIPPGDLDRSEIWCRRLGELQSRASEARSLIVEGQLTRTVGLTLEAAGCIAAIGEKCTVISSNGAKIEAEVVGFSGEDLHLMPTHDIRGLAQGARVIPTSQTIQAGVGDGLLGRVIDGTGVPIDQRGPLRIEAWRSLRGTPINPLLRQPITQTLDVGVRAINALLTMGRGQRSGIFAPSGVGKSTLLSMMTRSTEAEVIVVGLIGERGREVKEFIEANLGEVGLRRSVIVATPADTPPLLRQHGAMLATSVAEYFRDQGKHVLLLMDSLTRFSQAQREIGLSIGEPPATKGYPPSVFAELRNLVERAGTGAEGAGTITAFYTILVEGELDNDPVAECARAILDGHIVLSPRLAELGHFPAIDIEPSVSRVMSQLVSAEHAQAARRFRKLYSSYEQNRDLISIGAYTKGSDVQIDQAIEYQPRLSRFLQQSTSDAERLSKSVDRLSKLLA